MKNKELASIFNRIGDALEIKGEMSFKIIAYRKAARILENLTEDIEITAGEKKLEKIPGIGSGIAKKIEEYLKTGKMKKYKEVLSGIPESLLELLEIQNLGAKTIHVAYKELGVENLSDLKRVIREGSLVKLPGQGAKKIENIQRGIEIFEQAQERIPLYDAMNIVENVASYLKKAKDIGRLSPALASPALKGANDRQDTERVRPGRPLCPLADRLFAYRWGPHGAVQLALCQRPRRQVSAAHRGHRPRA